MHPTPGLGPARSARPTLGLAKAPYALSASAEVDPGGLSADDVTRILDGAPGPCLKDRTALNVDCGGGRRVSEVTHLRVSDIDIDIDSDRMLIRVDQGEGAHGSACDAVAQPTHADA